MRLLHRRGKGIGTRLIKASVDWFRKKKIDDLKIMVYAFNDGAKRLYQRQGFREYIFELKK